MARVLVVDDAAFMRKMVSDALPRAATRSSARPATARRPWSATRSCARSDDARHHDAREGRPLRPAEIIALDPRARVVMCSALGQESKVLESIKLGAKDFVVKPFQADRVLGAVEKALS